MNARGCGNCNLLRTKRFALSRPDFADAGVQEFFKTALAEKRCGSTLILGRRRGGLNEANDSLLVIIMAKQGFEALGLPDVFDETNPHDLATLDGDNFAGSAMHGGVDFDIDHRSPS